MPRTVLVDSGGARHVQRISARSHHLQADEPRDAGGGDAGFDPYELLLAALGACTSITVRMFAERRQWPLEGVRVALYHAKAHAEDCATCDTEVRMIDRIDVELLLFGPLSDDQLTRLLEVAKKCPVHRTLSNPISIRVRLSK